MNPGLIKKRKIGNKLIELRRVFGGYMIVVMEPHDYPSPDPADHARMIRAFNTLEMHSTGPGDSNREDADYIFRGVVAKVLKEAKARKRD